MDSEQAQQGQVEETQQGTESRSPLSELAGRLAQTRDNLRQNPPQKIPQINRVVTGTVLEGVIEGLLRVDEEFEGLRQQLAVCEFMQLPVAPFLPPRQHLVNVEVAVRRLLEQVRGCYELSSGGDRDALTRAVSQSAVTAQVLEELLGQGFFSGLEDDIDEEEDEDPEELKEDENSEELVIEENAP